MKAPCIMRVAAKAPPCLEIFWSTNENYCVDISRPVKRFQVLAPLSDPAFFANAQVGLWGHSITWSDEVDLGADLLYDLCREQAGLPTPTEFDLWIKRNHLSLSKAAECLGLSRRMVAHYRSGSKPIPKIVGLACKGWEAQQRKAIAA